MADSIEPTAPSTARPFLEFRPLLLALGMAADAKKLILASVGLIALAAGWSAIGSVLGPSQSWMTPLAPGQEFETISSLYPAGDWRGLALVASEPFRVVVSPFAASFERGADFSTWLRSILMSGWALVVWGLMGGAIARIAAVQATGNGGVGLRTAIRFAIGKATSLIGAPLTPLLVLGLFAACSALIGLLYRIPGAVGPTMVEVLRLVTLSLSLVIAFILIGLAMGWPLMSATVAVDGEDAPDALSRSYSYINQRTARYLVHVAASWLIGSIGLAVAIFFARTVLYLDDWGVGLGAPAELPSIEPAATIRAFWPRLAGLLVHAWVYSYFWSAATMIYLILRRDVDGTVWHAVYLPEHAADTFDGVTLPATPPSGPEPAEAT